jgi:IS5 family transposase
MKRQFGFEKTRLRGMFKNCCKVNVLAALANLFMVRHQLLCRT